jgi:DNA-directed RNA polymerase subunit F
VSLKRKSQKNKNNITFSEAKKIMYEHKKLTQSKMTAQQ